MGTGSIHGNDVAYTEVLVTHAHPAKVATCWFQVGSLISSLRSDGYVLL
jgi:hypothetical protein